MRWDVFQCSLLASVRPPDYLLPLSPVTGLRDCLRHWQRRLSDRLEDLREVLPLVLLREIVVEHLMIDLLFGDLDLQALVLSAALNAPEELVLAKHSLRVVGTTLLEHGLKLRFKGSLLDDVLLGFSLLSFVELLQNV